MELEEIRLAHKEQRNRADKISRAGISEMALPIEVNTPEEITNLGDKIRKSYKKRRDELVLEHGEGLPKIVAVALHEYWFACWSNAAFFQVSIEDGDFNDNDYTRTLATPEGYAEFEGWASIVSNAFADLVPSQVRVECIADLTGHEILDARTALRCMSIYWFAQASAEMSAGNTEMALDLIHEAEDALALYFSGRTWDDAWKEATRIAEEDSGAKVRSELARKAGRAAHAETYALKAEIKEFWRNNISSSISNDAAAALMMRQFPLNLRTLSKYVSEFKKAAG